MTNEKITPVQREIVDQIEGKDRKFRAAQAIFLALIFVILVIVVAVQFKTLSGVQEQLAQQKILLEEQKSNTDQIQATTAELSKQLDCIAKYFAQRDRAETTISNLEQCTIIRPDGSVVRSLPRAPQRQAPDQPAQDQPAEPAPAIRPDMPGLSPVPPQNPQQPETPDPPAELLGIPLCIPFTGICVR